MSEACLTRRSGAPSAVGAWTGVSLLSRAGGEQRRRGRAGQGMWVWRRDSVSLAPARLMAALTGTGLPIPVAFCVGLRSGYLSPSAFSPLFTRKGGGMNPQ